MARFQDTDNAEDGKDVAGHREPTGTDQPGTPPAAVRRPKLNADEDDTEGHLYSTGPSTQGEALPRVPGDNPHGD
jgi:hypothetical protein